MTQINYYFDANEGFINNVKKRKKVQKIAYSFGQHLINDATFLCTGLKAIHSCSFFYSALDEQEDRNKTRQALTEFQAQFLEAAEKINQQNNTHDKKEGIRQARLVTESTYVFINDSNMNQMKVHFHNIVVTASIDKESLAKIVKTRRISPINQLSKLQNATIQELVIVDKIK